MNSNNLSGEFNCGICLSHMYHPTTLLCQHNFCWSCISKLEQKECPICRKPFITPSDYNHMLDTIHEIIFPEEHDNIIIMHKQEQEREMFINRIRKELYDELLYNNISIHNSTNVNNNYLRINTGNGSYRVTEESYYNTYAFICLMSMFYICTNIFIISMNAKDSILLWTYVSLLIVCGLIVYYIYFKMYANQSRNSIRSMQR
jgi:hypothetical protein